MSSLQLESLPPNLSPHTLSQHGHIRWIHKQVFRDLKVTVALDLYKTVVVIGRLLL